jgi:putative nucleotidyltransferase with HDIG domain
MDHQVETAKNVIHLEAISDRDYSGRILSGNYSAALKTRVSQYIERYQAYEKTGSAAILYIAAWQGGEPFIWYEFTGKQFMDLLECSHDEVAERFRKAVIDQRVYTYLDKEVGIRKEVYSRQRLHEAWEELREEGKKRGSLEAVYKIALPSQDPIWLKDQATIEIYEQDGICLSLGFLTFVSKEMEAEDAITRHHEQLEKTVAKRTAELTALNSKLKQEIVERRQAEARLQETCHRLQKNIDEVIRAISLTVEPRDPYTAGHQKRSTELAVAIAHEMGLPENQIKGIRMAGLIHDIGKISIPTEILSKPGKLNDAERQLIQRHPKVAYDILKQIDFAWPVDLIVLQHHEKIDGSGYPQGLKGEQIRLEARILCVADVVETMDSHRPYRPGLGLDEALNEISKHRGRLYDPTVVDACLRLFRQKGFQLGHPSD